MKKKTILIIMSIPILFVIVYMYVYEQGWLSNVYILERPIISGRQYIYIESVEALKGNWVLGNYAFSPFQNKHNVLLTVVSFGGLIGALLFFMFYFIGYMRIFKKLPDNGTARTAFLCMVILYIGGVSEAAMFIDGIMYAGLFWPLLLFSHYSGNRRQLLMQTASDAQSKGIA